MIRIISPILLILWLFSSHEALAQPRRTLLDAGAAGRVVAVPHGMGEELRLTRDGRTLWKTRTQRFTTFRDGAPIPIGDDATAIGIIGWTGGAYCCWTLHLFRQGAAGLSAIASATTLPAASLASGSALA